MAALVLFAAAVIVAVRLAMSEILGPSGHEGREDA